MADEKSPEALVEALYHSRDTLKRGGKALAEEQTRVLGALSEWENSGGGKPGAKAKAKALFLRGKALNVLPDHSPEAETLLGKSVKLDPACVDCWIALGECFWKRKDYASAKNCFSGALQRDPARMTALRSLSMLLRQMGGGDEYRRNIKESVDLAKKAVSVDAMDGESWYVLGNGYLALFFHVTRDVNDLNKSLKAYQQSESKPHGKTNPDLYFNRANVHAYLQDYDKALADYTRASELDPEWSDPDEQRADLLRFLSRVNDCIVKKGFLKPRKVKQITEGLRDKGASVKDLKTGSQNEDKVVYAQNIAPVSNETQLPRCFLMMDRFGTVFVAPFYNLSPDAIKADDIVSISYPVVTDISVETFGQNVAFRTVQPVQLIHVKINDQPIPPAMLTQSSVTLENLVE